MKTYEYIDFSPDNTTDEEYRAWQGCPSVAVTKGGRIFAAWFTGGEGEPCIHNYNLLFKSDDGGMSWSNPLLKVSTDYKNRIRHIDIELWINDDNSLWVMWTNSPFTESSTPFSVINQVNGISVCDYQKDFPSTTVMVCHAPDADTLKWEEPRLLCNGFMRNRPIKLQSGRIIAPAYAFLDDDYILRYSDDNGRSFYDVTIGKKPQSEVYDETIVYEYNGILNFFARTNKGYIAHSQSTNCGKTWKEISEYDKAPSSRFYIGVLKNGMVAYVRNISDDSRTGIKILLSNDGGETFDHDLILDERENVSYPEIAEDNDGNIYIIYDRERNNTIKLNTDTKTSNSAKEILVCKITVEDIKSGKLSPNSYIAKVISKAKVNTIDN